MKVRLGELFGQARVLPALLGAGSVLGTLALAALLPAPCAAAREYRISVDGQPVQFDGMSPVQVSGRVLVPLRGVLERIGAKVEWSASSKTVVAQRGSVRLELPVGQRSAAVNGRSVTLDVPAMIMRGNVMVPL
ncbi:MAG TPA: copper amine oxidase N-terminal domain-containing protein, partial [Armatimonadota bacterium]|nr:copper amine oxidase N-terminal domain-containing protein [Armatimonadota bacterium]